MSFRYPHPDNERSFEKFCLKFLRRHWNNPHLKLYGRRGEEQLGIDIIDPSFSPPFRAAQCKHHEPDITIPPSEIQEEVDKALKFDPPIEQYAILTTGRVTTHGQRKILEINRDHRTKGLFIVELLSWSDIEDYLDDYPDVVSLLTTVTNAQVEELTSVVGERFDRLEGQIIEVTTTTIRTSFDAEIDECESYLKSCDPQRCQIFLEKIRQRHWDELSAHQKYRVKCGFSNCYLVQGKDVEAGRILLEAKALCPDTDKAQINEAIGYELIGESATAHGLASKLIGSNPHSSKLVACLIRSAPQELPFDEIRKFSNSVVDSDSEVCIALALRAMQVQRFSDAEAFSLTAQSASPDWVGPKLLLGQATLNVENAKFQQNFWNGSTPLDQERLNDAVRILSEAITLGKRHDLKKCISDAYLCRAMANALLRDNDAADCDFEEAKRHAPDNANVYHKHGFYLFNNGKIDECIVALQRAASLNPTNELLFLLASVLSDRTKEGDKESALGIYTQIVLTEEETAGQNGPTVSTKLQSPRLAAFHAAIEEYIDADKIEEANAFLDRVPSTVVSELSIMTARSLIKHVGGDFHGAAAIAEATLRKVDADSSQHDLRGLALLLGKLERHKDALPLWLRITEAGNYGPDVRNLVTSAERVKRYDVILKTAEAVRNSGIKDSWLFYKEIAIVENFDLDRAVILLKERIQSHPNEKRARIHLSHLGLKWQRPELVDARPESLPTPEEATPSGGELAVEILRQSGDRLEAVKYAYEFVRLNYDEPAANASLIMAFFAPSTKPLVIPESGEVKEGMAVRYTENDTKERWAIIEDSPNPRPELDEFSVNHKLSQAFLNRRVGDTVVLSKSSGRDRTAVINEVISKYVFRLRDITESWQLRFPNEPFIQVFRVTTTDPTTGQEVPDFTDIKLVADRRYENIQEAEDAYRNNLMPIHLLGQLVGIDPFLTFNAAALKADLPVRSNRGQENETVKAREILGSSHTIVIDIFALATLYLIGNQSILQTWRGKLVVSQSTATELKSVLSTIASKATNHGSFGKSEIGYHYTQVSGETVTSEAARFSTFVEEVFKACEVRGCPELAEIDPEFRDHLVQAFGQHGLESMLLARTPGHVLWTEDLAVSDIASSEFAVRRVWTQVLMEYAAESGIASADDYFTASAKIMGLDFQSTSFNPFILIKCGKLSNWIPENWPFNKALSNFAHLGVQLDQALLYAAMMITAMYREILLVEVKQSATVAILERLSCRRHGFIAIRVLNSMFPQLFGVDVLAAREASDIVRAWTVEASRRPSLGHL